MIFVKNHEGNLDVCRCVNNQVPLEDREQGQTGSHVRPHLDQRKAWVVRNQGEDQEVQSELKNMYRLREIINSIMLRTNKYEKARRVVARILAAHKTSIPVGGEDIKKALQMEPSVDLLNKARDLMLVVSAWEVTPFVPKLESLGPVYEKGVWTCRGRLGKVVNRLLGKENLPILHNKGRLAELLMIKAHYRNHEGVAGTLAASRAEVWILKVRYLARKVVKECVYCKAKHAKLQTQRMGALPVERLSVGSRPFQSVCLDLLGPTLVKAMTNKRATMKVWPIIFVCQSTGAVHAEVMHDYGTQAFLLQWSRFTAIRGVPGVAVSDCGSQLKSVKNTVAYPEAQDPKHWDWDEVEATGARGGTDWRFVPPGAQFRNGLAERRVAALKSTLNHLLANTIMEEKPTLHYAELQTLLSRAASIVNDRPIGLRSLTEDELVPLTVNQLLLGRTATVEPAQVEVDPEGYVAADQYLRELMTVWWKLWRQRALPHLLPYYKWEQARRHRNLQPGDVCMLLYESKVVGSYRLCRVTAVTPSDDECVRTVTVGYLPRKQLKQTVYRPVPLRD